MSNFYSSNDQTKGVVWIDKQVYWIGNNLGSLNYIPPQKQDWDVVWPGLRLYREQNSSRMSYTCRFRALPNK